MSSLLHRHHRSESEDVQAQGQTDQGFHSNVNSEVLGNELVERIPESFKRYISEQNEVSVPEQSDLLIS